MQNSSSGIDEREGLQAEERISTSSPPSVIFSALDSESQALFTRLVDAMFQGNDLRECVHRALTRLGEAWEWERITLYRFLPDTDSVEAVLSSDAPREWSGRFNLRDYPELMAARQKRKAIFIPRVSRDIFINPHHDRLCQAGIASIHVLPISQNCRIVGVISFKAFHPHPQLQENELSVSLLLATLLSFILPDSPIHPLYMTLHDYLEVFRSELKEIIWNADDFIYVLDKEDRYLAVNRSLCEVTGYTPEEIYADDFPGLSVPEERALSRERLNRLFKGDPLNPRIANMRTKRGEIIPVDVRVHPITDGEKVIAVMGIARDMRPVIQYREQEADLKAQIRDKMNALLSANRQLEEEKAFRSTFISAAAHHLKTPIATVMATLEILKNDIAPTLDTDLEPLLEPASQAIHQMEKLIKEFVDLASIQSHAGLHITQDYSVQESIRPLVKELAPMLESRSITIDFRVDPEDLTWTTDRGRVLDIVDTLLTNALNASPDGGRITLSAQERDGRLAICVQDEGPGISKDRLERLLFPSTRPSASGLRQGVGLALARALADLLKGSLRVRNLDDGTVFQLECPRLEVL